jgi:hypothetical protein
MRTQFSTSDIASRRTLAVTSPQFIRGVERAGAERMRQG